MHPEELAHPTTLSFSQGMRAYSSSKLCNLLTARSFGALDLVKKKE